MSSSRSRWPFVMAALAAMVVLAITAVITLLTESEHDTTLTAEVTARADGLARDMSDIVARESAAVETLEAFVELSDYRAQRLVGDFPVFAKALMDSGPHIRSVQLAPGSILEYVYPLQGNEAALGLDLMADPGRRALLEPTLRTGETTIQGPVGLVQGGNGLIVRRPTYTPDGEFWGFTAVLLDWDLMAKRGAFFERQGLIVGLRRAGSDEVLDGDPAGFGSGAIVRTLNVGGTDTAWEIGVLPVDGWSGADRSVWIMWIVGLVVAAGAAALAYSRARQPEVLRRERQHAIDQREIAEARYETAFEHAAVGIAIARWDGSIVQTNPAFRRIVGADESEVVEYKLVDFLHPDHTDSHLERMNDLRVAGSSFEHETRFGGEISDRWGRMRVALAPHMERAEPAIVAVVEDTTERRQWELALAASETRFRTLFESAPVAIQREDWSAALTRCREFAPDADSLRRHLEANPSALEEVLSLVPVTDANPSSRDLARRVGGTGEIGRTLGDAFNEATAPTFLDTIAGLFEGRDTEELAVTTTDAHGEPLYLDVRWRVPVVNGTMDHTAVLVTILDITRLRTTERQLQDLLASKDRFLASVAHELRTPLTAVVGFAQELVDHPDELTAVEHREFTELIGFHGAEMAHLIEDLLVLARADIGEVHVEPRRLDLASLVCESLRKTAGIDVDVATPDGPVEAMADATRVRQIVRNLGTNALRYGGSEVSVAVRRCDGRAVLEVCDNGPELDPQEARRIFEPYARRMDTTSLPGSIGLGLTVSRSLARLQGGDLILVREGEWNVFRASFPLAEDAGSVSSVA